MYAVEHAIEHPGKPAIIMAGTAEIVTYGEYERRCNQVTHLLRAAGLERGDHIAILSENHPRLLEIEGAAERIGLYYTLVNAHLGPDEVAYIVDDCRARVVFSSVAKLEIARRALACCPRVERTFVLGLGETDGVFEPYESAIADLPGDPVPDQSLGLPMLYSSGTTGRPKGIVRPLPGTGPQRLLPIQEQVKDLFTYRPGQVYLNPAPMYHSAPQFSVGVTLRLGGTAVIMEEFDAEQWLALIERYRVTHTQLVPTMFHRLLRLPQDLRARYDLSSLECVVHAAAPCPVPVKRAMIDWLGPIVVEYYGATESNGITFCTAREWLAHPGTVGRAVVGELLILDERGDLCPPGVDGTVWFRGATNFEYFGDAVQTAESRSLDGTASTVGDVGHVDGDGYLYLTDRKTHMIISGGVNVYPQETENLLSTHPAVADVAVIGVPNADLGEEVKAVVQPADPAAAGPHLAGQLIGFCRDHLASVKCPRSVDFVDELPRTPTGKLVKRRLTERYAAAAATK